MAGKQFVVCDRYWFWRGVSLVSIKKLCYTKLVSELCLSDTYAGVKAHRSLCSFGEIRRWFTGLKQMGETLHFALHFVPDAPIIKARNVCAPFCDVKMKGDFMQQKTHIANVLERNNCKDRYDAQAKQILSDKSILAWILKYTTSEFKDYPIELIRTCIEGEPEVGTHQVFPSPATDASRKFEGLMSDRFETKQVPEAIVGLDTVDKVPGEGEVTYDVRFCVLTPTAERIKLIINVESQKKYNPGYDIVTRGIFYCARMVAAQKETEFIGSDYDGIKKVYSIWISMENPLYAQHTITSYHFGEYPLYGILPEKKRYDLMELVLVCLGNPNAEDKGNELHGLLDTLFSPELSPHEKENILYNDYQIQTTVEMEGGLREMCNLSDLIEERGIAKGKDVLLLSQIQKKLAKGKSLEQIADELEETVETILPLYEQVQRESDVQ